MSAPERIVVGIRRGDSSHPSYRLPEHEPTAAHMDEERVEYVRADLVAAGGEATKDLAVDLIEARAEIERLRGAAQSALDVCRDAASMACTCTGYYTCNGCERAIAERADDAAEYLAAVLPSGAKEARDGDEA